MKYSNYEIVSKGWGFEKIVVNKPEYCGKILVFKKGKKCSYHYHRLKDEVFYCRGKFLITYGYSDNIEEAEQVELNEGESFHVPVGLRHQMLALEDGELYEFSTQDFKEDSIRVVKGN